MEKGISLMDKINLQTSIQQTHSYAQNNIEKRVDKQETKISDQVSLGNSDTAMPDPIKPHKKWLFINYLAADCNLTEHQLANIDQQEIVGSDDNTHLVAYMDVGNKPHSYGDWQHSRAIYINKDETPLQFNSELIEEFGEVNMSDPKTLTKYVVDAIGRFPADHVCLVMNSHGGGFTGAMADDGGSGAMPIPQMREALEKAQEITGKKIDIIGFDACLMAESEVAYELKDTADIMLASEETENGPGWKYNNMLGGKSFAQAVKVIQDSSIYKIDVGPKEFAKVVVDINRQNPEDIPTFSAIDLSKMTELKDSLNEFAKVVRSSEDKDAVREAITSSESYGGGWAPYCDIRDIGHIADNIIEFAKDDNLKNSAQEVKLQLEKAVMHNAVNPDEHPNSQGLSIFAPTTKGTVKENYTELKFAQDTEWDEMLEDIGVAKRNTKDIKIRRESESESGMYWPDGSPRK